MAAAQAGARLVIVNREPTPLDGLAEVVLREPLEEVVPALAACVSALVDARGCLTEAGFAALDAAPPGRGPADAAAHLAACARCQRRFLARGGKEVGGDQRETGHRRWRRRCGARWRSCSLVLILVAMALIGVRLLAAR